MTAPGDQRAVLVGRAAELRFLEDALSAVEGGAGSRTVTVLGAAGIGKTRLVRDFLQKAHGGQGRVFRGTAREGDAAFSVFARILRARFGLVEGMDVEAQRDHVREEVAQVLDDRKIGDVCHFLGQILGLDFFDSPLIRALAAEPAQASFIRRAVLQRFFEADAQRGQEADQGPLTLVFDDLQHAHREALELLAHLTQSVNAPILFLCLGRSQFVSRFDGWPVSSRAGARDVITQERHSSLELTPLSETDAAAVMQDLLSPCGDDPNVEELVEGACNLAGGNPALLEQMVSVFQEMKVIEADPFAENDQWTIHIDRLEDVRLPMSVEDAVQARIAALSPEERTLLERAAMMGAVFWGGGLLVLARADADTPRSWLVKSTPDSARVQQLLAELVERDYVLKLPDSTFPGDDEYVFKHNLERETLAKNVAAGLSRRYHAVLADWLSFKGPVRGNEEYLSMLAHHYEKAGAKVSAGRAYLDAADAARSHYANAKAAELYEKGLALVASSASVQRVVDAAGELPVDQLLSTYHHYGDVLQLLGHMEQAESCFRKMLALAYRLDLRAKGGASHGRIGRLFRDMGRLDESAAHLEAALALFESAADDRGVASSIDDIGKLHWLRGDYEKALEYTQRSLAMRRRLGERRSIALSLNNLGLVYQDSGQFTPALDAFEQALRIRREINDLVGVSITLNNLGTVAQDQGDDARALALFREALDIASETGDKNRITLVLTNLGETHNRLGDPDRALAFLKEARSNADELGDKLGLAEAIRGIGKAYLAKRDLTKAREATSKAVALFREVDSKVQLGVALRSLGEVVAEGSAGGPESHEAREHLLQSVRIFEQIGNHVELGRSCRAYVKLLETSLEFQLDPAAQAEARAYRQRADDVQRKLRASSAAITQR